MQFNMKLVALLSIATGTFASDVFAVFFTENNNKVGNTNYDVSNDSCFLNAGSTKVSFSQATANSFAEGPYCLTGYSDDQCSSSTGSQTFEHVPVANRNENGVKVLIDGAVASGSHKKWTLGHC